MELEPEAVDVTFVGGPLGTRGGDVNLLVNKPLGYLCTKNKTVAPLHVATLTIERELPK